MNIRVFSRVCLLLVRQASLVALVRWKVLTMITDRKSCSQTRAGRGVIPPAKPGEASARAEVDSRELESASLNQSGNGQPLRRGEASIRAQVWSSARTGFPGVKGVGACAQSHWELGRPAGRLAWRQQAATGNHNRRRGPSRASERPIVAMKRLTAAERRGLGEKGADSEVRVG